MITVGHFLGCHYEFEVVIEHHDCKSILHHTAGGVTASFMEMFAPSLSKQECHLEGCSGYILFHNQRCRTPVSKRSTQNELCSTVNG